MITGDLHTIYIYKKANLIPFPIITGNIFNPGKVEKIKSRVRNINCFMSVNFRYQLLGIIIYNYSHKFSLFKK